jgi:hypothetical protein
MDGGDDFSEYTLYTSFPSRRSLLHGAMSENLMVGARAASRALPRQDARE